MIELMHVHVQAETNSYNITFSKWEVEHSTWHLAMNLNPSDGHIMDYTVGWAEDNWDVQEVRTF